MAFTNLEIKLKADVKDLKVTLRQTTKEVEKLKSNLEKMSGPLNKMGKAMLDNTKLATKLKNIGAKRTKIIENNLKLALSQVKATEKQLQTAGKLDAKTEKALKKRATLLTQIAEKEIAGIKKAEAALKEKNAATRKALKEAERVAKANKKAEEIQNNISVIAEKNRRLALKSANIGATAVERIKNQLKFDLQSLDIQREKLRVARRLNRDVVAGLNRQRSLIREMAARQIQVIDPDNIERSTSLLGRLRNSFSRLGAGIIVFNQALELIGKAIRAFRVIFGNTVQKFADFETALIGVSKTTTLAGESLELFGNDIQQLSAKIPATNEELLKIAEVSGQLGVDGRENLLNFAETMTRVAVSTNLTAEQAASDFTKILNVTRTPIDQIDEFASVIVRLGNNFATNEQKITRMTNEVARATTAFNVAAEDTAAFATAMSAMGIRAEIGGSVLARAMVRIQDALVAGGVEMQTLAKITQQTQEQLRKTFSTDATKVTREFLRGLKRMKDEGKLIIPVMADFGLKGDEVNKVLPPLVANVDSLGKAFAFAREEIQNATALTEESDKQFATLNSSINTMMNSIRTLGTEIGRAFAPLVTVLADSIKSLAQGLTFAARGLSFFTDTIALIIKEGKTFLLVMGGVGAALAVLIGKGAAVASVLKIIGFGMAFIAGKTALATVALAGFVATGLKLTVVAVSIAAVGAAIEVLLKNITNLKALGEFTEAIFAKMGNNLTILFNDIGASFLRMLRDMAGSLGVFGTSVVTQLNALSNELDANSFKAKEQQANLNAEIDRTAAALDFGFTGAFLGDIKKIVAGLQEATIQSGKFGAEGEKVAKVFEKRAATLAEQARSLRKLSKILKENRLLELDIQKLRGGGRNQILATLQAHLDIVEAKKQLFINQRNLNDLSKEELRIVNALIKQQELLKEKAAAALDASRPDRILKALSVEVVFGSIDGFVNGLKTVANLFDEVTAGYFTALPRALFEGFSLATEAMTPMFDAAGDLFSSAFDSISELFTNNLQEFEDFFGVDLAEIFTDLGDILSDALEGTSDFFSGLFDDANKDVEGVFNAANNVPEQVGSGDSAVADFFGMFSKGASLEQEALNKEIEAANLLKGSAEALQTAAEILKESAPGAEKAGETAAGPGGAIGPEVGAIGPEVGAIGPEVGGPIGPEMGGFGPVTEAAAGAAGGAAGAAAGGAAGAMGAAAGPLGMVSAIADAVQALIDFIPQMLDKIANIFSSLTELPMKILEGLDKVFASILKFITDFIPNIIKIIPEILKSITKFLNMLPKAVLALLKELPGLLIEFFQSLPEIIEELVTSLVAAAPEIAIAIVEFIVRDSWKIGVEIAKFIIIGLPIAVFKGVVKGIKRVWKAIGRLFSGVSTKPLEKAVEKVVKSVERAVTGVGTQRFAVQDIALARKAKEQFKALEDSINDASKKSVDALTKGWRKLWTWLDTQWKALWSSLVEIWRGVWTIFEEIINGILRGVKQVLDGIFDAIGAVVDAAVKLISGIIEAIKGIIQGVAAVFKKIWDDLRAAVQRLFDFFGDIGNSIVEAGTKFFDKIKEAGKVLINAGGKIFEKIKDAAKPLIEAGGKIFEKLKELGGKITEPIKRFFSNLGSQIGDAFTSVFRWAENLGGAVGKAFEPLGKLFKPLTDAMGRLLEPFQDVIKALQDILKKLGLGGGGGGEKPVTPVGGVEVNVGGGGVGKGKVDEDSTGNPIVDAFNEGLKRIGIGLTSLDLENVAINIPDLSIIKFSNFNEGGLVTGAGGRDSVSAMLTPGEFVVNKDAVGALGVSALSRINEGRLASGDTSVSVNMTVNTTQVVDSNFIRNRIVPVMRDELKRASVDGSFVMDKRGLR